MEMKELVDEISELAKRIKFDRNNPIFGNISNNSWNVLEGGFKFACLYYHWLAAAMLVLKPKMVLELGTSLGRGFLSMFYTLPKESQIITISIEKEFGAEVSNAIKSLDRCHFIQGDDLEEATINKVNEISENDIDFLFIDTNHTGEQLSRELELYLPMVKDGSLIVLDDILMSISIMNVWAKLPYEKIDLTDPFHLYAPPAKGLVGFGVFKFTEEIK